MLLHKKISLFAALFQLPELCCINYISLTPSTQMFSFDWLADFFYCFCCFLGSENCWVHAAAFNPLRKQSAPRWTHLRQLQLVQILRKPNLNSTTLIFGIGYTCSENHLTILYQMYGYDIGEKISPRWTSGSFNWCRSRETKFEQYFYL